LVPVRTGCLFFSSKTVVIFKCARHSTCAGAAVGSRTPARASAAPRASPIARSPDPRARFLLYNGGHADFKGRVGEKHGLRGAERGLSRTPPGWRLSGDEWADRPTDCDMCIKRLLATDAACLLGYPNRLQHSVPAVLTVTRFVVTVAWVSSCTF
jgi:hypothetical protein